MNEDLLKLDAQPVGSPKWDAIVLFRINRKLFNEMSDETFKAWYSWAIEYDEKGKIIEGLQTLALNDKVATMSYIAELYYKFCSKKV